MQFLAFSDFHGLFGFKDHFMEVKKKVEKYKPDLVVICGDLQDRGSIKLLEQKIQSVKFPNMFFVWGNSEEQLDPATEINFAGVLFSIKANKVIVKTLN
ncbi:MAG: metallophosphoesterase [Candidatus Helarchaeota archaeon]